MSGLNNMEADLNKSLKYIKEAAENQVDIVLFPEVQLTNFFPQYPNVNTEEYKDRNSGMLRQALSWKYTNWSTNGSWRYINSNSEY